VWEAEVFVKAVVGGQELRMMAEMPFAEASRGESLLFDELREGHFIAGNAVIRAMIERPRNADAHVVAAGHQTRARCRADGLGHVKVGKDSPFVRESIQIWSAVGLGAKWADIGIAHVVNKDDDDVGRTTPAGGRAIEREKEERENDRQVSQGHLTLRM